ncbi:hypothetical protein LOK49_LG04G02323 [Camellia lanceoleosa]|uniref:Uncharacterized protein n=1 Tax=Camellia lanceoleosa TaxID=1840588 RepID=A0ACC0HVL5_9ERIC|nr:hypothetical protein LOK49_LG04G02323 [Camellia lanceoleosa]
MSPNLTNPPQSIASVGIFAIIASVAVSVALQISRALYNHFTLAVQISRALYNYFTHTGGDFVDSSGSYFTIPSLVFGL